MSLKKRILFSHKQENLAFNNKNPLMILNQYFPYLESDEEDSISDDEK